MPTDISGKISIGTKIGETIFCIAQLERLLRHSAPTTPMRILILLLPRRRCATGSSLGPRHGAHLLLSHYIWLPTHICGVCIGSVMTVHNTARKQARATTKMWSKFVHRLRSILQLAMCRLQDLRGKLGGAGNLVAIDESWMMTKNGFAEAFVEDKPRAPKPQSRAWWKLIWQMFAAGDSRQDGEDFANTCGIMSYPALWFSLMLTLDTDGLPRKTPATCTGASITNRRSFLAPKRSLGCAKSSQATLQF